MIANRRRASFRPKSRPCSSSPSERSTSCPLHARPGQRAMALLESFLPFGVRAGHLAAALAGIALIMLSRGLWRHKRAAYLLTVALLAFSAVSHLAQGSGLRGGDRRARGHGLAAHRGGHVLREARHAVAQTGRSGAARRVCDHAGVRDRGLLAARSALQRELRAVGRHPANVRDVHPVLRSGACSRSPGSAATSPIRSTSWARSRSVSRCVVLLRPVVHPPPGHVPTSAERARAIVEAHGDSSLAAMVLLPDKSYWFSEGGSVVAYAVSGGIAVALGDPIGPAEDLAERRARVCGIRLAKRLAADVLRDGRRFVLRDTRRLGYSSMCLGYEAIVPLGEFTPERQVLQNHPQHHQPADGGGVRRRGASGAPVAEDPSGAPGRQRRVAVDRQRVREALLPRLVRRRLHPRVRRDGGALATRCRSSRSPIS